MIVDPWGVVLAEQNHGAGVIHADLEPARLTHLRQTFPAIKHRQFFCQIGHAS
jgi:nitrilase